MAKTIKYYVHLRLFLEQGQWVSGGGIEDYVRALHSRHPKGGTVGRVLRTMTEPPGTDQPAHLLKKVERGFVWYRINPRYGRPIVMGQPLAPAFDEQEPEQTKQKGLF